MAKSPLVSADWLKANVDAPDVQVLDATWVPPFLKDRPNGRAVYQAGHIPGASYFDIDEIADPETALKHMLPSPATFAAKVGVLGVSNDAHIVVYDNNGFFASARAWWMFRAMGHDQISVLDGGLNAWISAGGKQSSDTATPNPGTFKAHLRDSLVRNEMTMQDHVEAQDATVLDARDHGRFSGSSPEPRPDLPSGHMPGSLCVPASGLVNADKTLKSVEELKPMFNQYLQDPIVTSCGSGVSAAVISLALAQLGKWDVALYDGSWSEWAANADNPIAIAS